MTIVRIVEIHGNGELRWSQTRRSLSASLVFPHKLALLEHVLLFKTAVSSSLQHDAICKMGTCFQTRYSHAAKYRRKRAQSLIIVPNHVDYSVRFGFLQIHNWDESQGLRSSVQVQFWFLRLIWCGRSDRTHTRLVGCRSSSRFASPVPDKCDTGSYTSRTAHTAPEWGRFPGTKPWHQSARSTECPRCRCRGHTLRRWCVHRPPSWWKFGSGATQRRSRRRTSPGTWRSRTCPASSWLLPTSSSLACIPKARKISTVAPRGCSFLIGPRGGGDATWATRRRVGYTEAIASWTRAAWGTGTRI